MNLYEFIAWYYQLEAYYQYIIWYMNGCPTAIISGHTNKEG